MPNPTVSVLTTCYNQADLVQRAIESVQNQQNVDFEHIIIDDGSTDGTIDAIITCPHTNITLLIRPHRGLMTTYLDGFSNCTGQYIAICDADDYWVNPLKLKWQVEYMESHPRAAICFTPVEVHEADGRQWFTTYNTHVDYDVILHGGCPMMSPGVMIRAGYAMPFFNVMKRKDFFTWHYPLYLYLSQHYQIGRIPEVTAVYTKSTESFSNTRLRAKRLRYILGIARIKWYFITKYGCKPTSLVWTAYRFIRDIYSVIFRRWYARP